MTPPPPKSKNADKWIYHKLERVGKTPEQIDEILSSARFAGVDEVSVFKTLEAEGFTH